MKIQNDTGVTYAANTNRYSNTQNAGSKTAEHIRMPMNIRTI